LIYFLVTFFCILNGNLNYSRCSTSKNQRFTKKLKVSTLKIRILIKTTKLDPTTKDQLRRASFSIVLNIAEGSGRFSKADRRNFYVISRSSIFECIAILDVLKDENALEGSQYKEFYNKAEEISKMLFAMIKNLS
jgi:four helix bundle protein